MSTTASAAPPNVAPRRSKRLASSAPPVGAGQPASPHTRWRRRCGSPSGHARGMDNSSPLVVILDDNEPRQAVEAEELKKQVEEDVEAEEPEEVNKDVDVLEELPGWLPDGWIMEVRCGDNGSIHRYYTSPVSGYTFSTKMETLHYLFSEMDERVLESQACPDDNELHRMHTWLPDGWVIEVRAGGKKMEKMYKFYVHLPTGMRFLSKENVLLYSNEGKVSRCDMKGLCDTSSEENILATVEFNPDGLPEGWVKEIIFRKCNDGIRKDPYYTDPVSHHVFRTLKSVISYLETGEITKHAYIPRRSVTDMYSFDKCTDLPQSMLKRLKIQGKANKKPIGASVITKKLPNGQASNKYDFALEEDPSPIEVFHVISADQAEGGTCLNPLSEPKEKKFKAIRAIGKDSVNSNNTDQHGGSTQKLLKQTAESISDCAKSSHKESEHIIVKKELGIGGGEQMPKEKTLEYTNMKEHVVVIQELDDTSNTTGRSLSPRVRDKLNLLINPDLHEHKNGMLNGAAEKLACSSIHKFYMRRSSNHTALKKG